MVVAKAETLYKRIKLEPYLSLTVKLKLIKDLNLRHNTMNMIYKQVGKTLEIIAIEKEFGNG